MLDHPELRAVTNWTLSTRDAHAFYARFGFVVHPRPQAQMVWRRSQGNRVKPGDGLCPSTPIKAEP
jgi:hypothetical protein